MKAINTIPRDEYGQMLYEAAQIISKRIARLANEEDSESRTADNKGEDENALKHYLRAHALRIAANALLKTPRQFSTL